MQVDPLAATESLEQLLALGYVEQPDADNEKTPRRTLTELSPRPDSSVFWAATSPPAVWPQR
jgi:hypothetical protein